MNNLIYIFLDFDGVLHGVEDNKRFSKLNDFIKMIEKYNDVRIVITSNWRQLYNYEVLADKYFSEIKDKIVGQTKLLKVGKNREDEILDYVNENHINQYLIIDDQERLFYKWCKNLYLVNGEIGLTKKDLENIDNLLRVM